MDQVNTQDELVETKKESTPSRAHLAEVASSYGYAQRASSVQLGSGRFRATMREEEAKNPRKPVEVIIVHAPPKSSADDDPPSDDSSVQSVNRALARQSA